MKIIKYKKLKSNKYDVFLDNNEKITLYEEVILKEDLLLKKEIDNIDNLLKINNQYEIYDISLKYLNHHVVSIYGMKEYLLRKNYNDTDIQNTIDKLMQKGYLNDEYYAKSYINNQINLSNDGPIKIIKNLENNNISSDIYYEYLNKYSDIWQSRIEKYVNKNKKNNKKSSYFFKNKMLINLINLGYEKEMINDVLNNVSIDNIGELKKLEAAKIRKKLEKKYDGVELERKIKEKLYQRGFFD